MNTIITITKKGVVSGITNIPLNKKIHDMHPETTSRITVLSDFTERRLSKEEILNVLGMGFYLDYVLQFVEYSGRRVPRQKFTWKPDYRHYEIDLKFKTYAT